MDVRVGLWRRLSTKELMPLNCGVGKDSWESLGLQGDPTSPFWRRSALGFLWRTDAKAETPALWPPYAKSWLIGKDSDAGRDWGAGGEGDDRGWDGWMASLTQWMWVWVNSRSWWWTGRPGVLGFMGSQRVGHNWATELNWTELILLLTCLLSFKFWLIIFPPLFHDHFFMNHISLFCYFFLLCKNILHIILYFNADNYSKIFVGLIMLFVTSVDLLIFYILMWFWILYHELLSGGI